MTFPKRLRLLGWDPKFVGCGDRLQLRLEAANDPKRGGRRWRGEVSVEIDRWFVLRLCQAISDMQAADRERIAQELDRLEAEILPLTVKPTK